jgi:hypothetical protein
MSEFFEACLAPAGVVSCKQAECADVSRAAYRKSTAVESLFIERLIRLQRLQHKCVNGAVKVSSTYDFAVFVDARGH